MMDTSEQDGAAFAPDLHDVRHLWLKAVLLFVWALISFGACFFARDLSVKVAEWSLGYWIAAQGALIGFIAIAVIYCMAMSYFERQDAAAPARDAAAPPQL